MTFNKITYHQNAQNTYLFEACNFLLLLGIIWNGFFFRFVSFSPRTHSTRQTELGVLSTQLYIFEAFLKKCWEKHEVHPPEHKIVIELQIEMTRLT